MHAHHSEVDVRVGLLEETGQPASELPALASTLLDNFEGAMMGYAEIGRLIYGAGSGPSGRSTA